MTWKNCDIPKNLPGHQLKPDYKEHHHKNQTFQYRLNSMTMNEPQTIAIDAEVLEVILNYCFQIN